jgi:glucose/arabinose dehydrogenase
MNVKHRRKRGTLLAVLALLGFVAGGEAQSQDRKARIEATLAKISLPKGFSISLYALAPNARTLAVGRDGKAIFVGVDGGHPHVIVPGGDKAESVHDFAPSMGFTMPHGVCLSKDGALFLVERNRVTRFDDAENKWRDAASIARVIVKAGELIPRSEESGGHSLRVCAVGPDEKLYISLGQPHNVAPPKKLDLYMRTGIGGIIRMNLDGSGREVFATGVRNSVGMDFDSQGRLWFTDNQVDRMGDDTPPGEINRADRPGLDFGFPWYGGGHVRTHEYAGDKPPEGVVFPQVEQDAHAADLGMIFYRGTMFPPEYRGGIFVAQHGSWDRSEPIGARVMFTRLGPGGEGGVTTTFAEGWNTGTGRYLGRPAGLAELPDGSLLVTDDQNGAIYRIAYRAP